MNRRTLFLTVLAVCLIAICYISSFDESGAFKNTLSTYVTYVMALGAFLVGNFIPKDRIEGDK